MSLVLTCPNCATRYVASSEGFMPPGRAVRCSRCQHTWFQDVSAPEAYETLYEEYEDDLGPAPAPDDRGFSSIDQFDEPFSEEIGRTHDEYDRSSGRSVVDEFRETMPRFSTEPDYELPERRRGSRVVSALVGLLGTVAVLGVLAAGTWYFRPQIVALIPQTEALYALLPVEQATSDYDLQNTGYIEAMEEGRQVLIVSGEVVNQTDKPIAVPVVQVTVRTIAGRDLDQWKFKPRGGEIEPGEARYFETRRLNPPEGAQRLHLIIVEED